MYQEGLKQKFSINFGEQIDLLNKHPRLRPTGVGEALWCITAKLVLPAIQEDTTASVGLLQVHAGHHAGYEAPLHAMHSIFDEENTDAVLLIEAGNAFNTLNRKVILHNILIICPAISTYYNFQLLYTTFMFLYVWGI